MGFINGADATGRTTTPLAADSVRPLLRRCVVILVACLMILSFATARTIVLVFDDSGSMDTEGTDRLSPALYATQALIGLLNPTDTLEVVRMSAPTTAIPLLPASDPQSSIQALSAWSASGWTPYRTVETAISTLKSKRATPLPDDEDYWLVVFTDGEFAGPQETAPADFIRIARDLDDLRSHFANRKLGIIFLGIGPNAGDFAAPWELAGATTFVASDTIAETPTVDGLAAMNSNQIIAALFEIAALIAGRDPESTAIERGLRATSAAPIAGNAALMVTTELPLKRLIMFEQGSTPTGLRVVEPDSSFVEGDRREAVRVDGPLEIAARGLHASISSISAANAGQVLGPGTFTIAITAGTTVSPGAIRFLPEVALGLDLSRDDGPTTRCVGDPLDLMAAITNSGDGSRVTLDTVRGVEMMADVVTPLGTRQVPFAPASGDHYTATTTIQPGLNEVSVTARYPGYFVLRSRIFLIEGVPCANDASLDLSRTTFETAPRFLAGAQPVADFQLQTRGVDPNRAPLNLEIDGLAPGWSLEVAGQRVEAPGGQLTNLQLNADGRLTATLAITAAAQPGRHEVRVRASSPDPLTRFARSDARFTTTLLPAQFRVTPTSLSALEIPPTAANAFEPAASEPLRVLALDPQVVLAGSERVRALLQGAPAGVQVTLSGATLSAASPTAELLLRDLEDTTLTLARNRSFTTTASAPLRVQFESLDPRIRLVNATVAWPLGLVVPPYSLEPAQLPALALTRTASALPQWAGEASLALRPSTAARAVGDEQLRISATGLPNGVELQLAGQRLSAANPSVEVLAADLLPGRLEITRNATYEGGAGALVNLRVESLDGRIALANNVAQLPLTHLDLDLGLTAVNTVVPVSRTTLPDFLPVARTVRIDILSSHTANPNSRITLRARDLPAGIHIELAGQRLTGSSDTALIPQRDFPVTLRVLRSNAFRTGGDHPVTLEASSDDPAVVWTQQTLTVTLRADPRTVTIEPLDTPWTVTQSAMSTRFEAQLLIDGEPAAGDELAAWALTVIGENLRFARGMPRLNPDTGTIAIALRRNCFLGVFCAPGLNTAGDRVLSTEVRAAADEVAQRDLRLAVTPVGWWWAWLWPLLQALLFVLAAIVLYRIITKPRFPRRGGFREIVAGFGANQPAPRYHPFVNLLPPFERLNPLTPERIQFRGLTIQADSRLGQALQLYVIRATPNARTVRINGAVIGPLPERVIENDRLTFPSGGSGIGASSLTFRIEGQ